MWVALALMFGGGVYALIGRDAGLEYFAGYVIEKALSVDNIMADIYQVPIAVSLAIIVGVLAFAAAASPMRNRFQPQESLMARTTIVFALILIALGVLGYIGTAATSVTALIPAFFGAVLGVLGWIGLNEQYRKHALHAAAAVGVIGFLGAARGLVGLMALMSGDEVDRPVAVVAQSVMAVLMAVFVGLCLKSFIDARRARAKPPH